jgi:hypothetical protein
MFMTSPLLWFLDVRPKSDPTKATAALELNPVFSNGLIPIRGPSRDVTIEGSYIQFKITKNAVDSSNSNIAASSAVSLKRYRDMRTVPARHRYAGK